MSRLLASITVLLTLVAAPAALANDSLLSGYGGPGNGEQAVLGSQLVRSGGGGGGGGHGGGGNAATGAQPSLRATAPAATGSTATAPALSSAPASRTSQAQPAK